MSKILIIGNGPSVLEHEYGNIIDSDKWDVVLRFNRWDKEWDGTTRSDFSKYVGTRCDCWVISDNNLDTGIERRDDYQMILVVCPKFKYPSLDFIEDIENSYKNIRFISYKFEDYINQNIVDFKPGWPTSGSYVLSCMVGIFDEVYLHGIDIFNIKYDNLHYFEDTPNKFKYQEIKCHNITKEQRVIEFMKNNYNVKLLEETQ